MRGPSRRAPWPCDGVIAGTGVMFGRPKDGAPLVARKTATLEQVAPTDYDYSAQSPLAERVQPYESLVLGYGLDQQQAFQDKRYKDAAGVDASVWPRVLGPEITSLTPATTDSTNGVIPAFGFELGGVLYPVVGRYALKRDSDAAFSVSKDFGAGNAALDAVAFHSNALAASRAFVALGDSTPAWHFDGTTWTQFATFKALAWCVVGRELYRAHDTNLLSRVDLNADPTSEANWGAYGNFRVGDKNSAIVRMAVNAAGTLVIFKTDGVYTLDITGDEVNLFPSLRLAADSENGKYPWLFGNHLHNTYREGHFRLDPNLEYEPIGPEKQTTAYTGNVKGRITAGIGHGTFAGYAGLWNPDTSTAYLMKFGAWNGPERLDVWHGSLSAAFANKKITAMWRSSIGATTGHQRAYIGFSDGSFAWFRLACTAHPAACSDYRFTTSGTLTHSRFTGLFQADAKTLRSETVTGIFPSGTDLTLEYRTDPNGAFTAFGTTFDQIREKADYPNNTSGTLADFRETLSTDSTSSTPQITGRGLHHAVRPALILLYEFQVLAADGLVKRDGTPLRLGAEAIRSAVKNAAEAQGSVTVVLPDESSQQLSVVDYGEAMSWDERLRQWRAGLAVKAVQFKTNTVYGTWDRALAYTWDPGFNWDQMEAI